MVCIFTDAEKVVFELANRMSNNKVRMLISADHTHEGQAANGDARADRMADLRSRAEMIDTYDAKAAGCTASAFEAPSHGPGNGRHSSSDSSKAPNGYGLQDCCRGQNGHASPSSSAKGLCVTQKQQDAHAEDAAAGKPGMQKPKRGSLARMPLMTYTEPCLERAYTLWHARHRWQVSQGSLIHL